MCQVIFRLFAVFYKMVKFTKQRIVLYERKHLKVYVNKENITDNFSAYSITPRILIKLTIVRLVPRLPI